MLSTRVTVENTGRLPLTNVHVQYLNNPGGIKLAPADVLDRLEPGEKAHFFPELDLSGGSYVAVVTADNGVSATSRFGMR
ncbi:hypothetical protein [Nitrososphaera sp.]|uniref:hypothetical protein n=1 Tax=Nitrososphaera sp. TaxID=1971748 RepID=UPI00307F75CB